MKNYACPLCGGENDCAAERAESALDCWCFRASIPEELLKRIPEPLIGVSCICRQCVERHHTGSACSTSSPTYLK